MTQPSQRIRLAHQRLRIPGRLSEEEALLRVMEFIDQCAADSHRRFITDVLTAPECDEMDTDDLVALFAHAAAHIEGARPKIVEQVRSFLSAAKAEGGVFGRNPVQAGNRSADLM
jgi:hypothetical protein